MQVKVAFSTIYVNLSMLILFLENDIVLDDRVPLTVKCPIHFVSWSHFLSSEIQWKNGKFYDKKDGYKL